MTPQKHIERLQEQKDAEINMFIGRMEAINAEIRYWRAEAKKDVPLLREKNYRKREGKE